MSEPSISYPTDDMHSSSSSQKKTLQDAWQAHQTYFNQQILTPISQLPKKTADPVTDHFST